MKVKQFTDVLTQVGVIYGSCGDTERQKTLTKFSKLFEGHSSKTVAAFIKLVESKQTIYFYF